MEVVAFAHGSRQVRNVSTNAQRDPSRNIVGSAALLFFLRARRQHATRASDGGVMCPSPSIIPDDTDRDIYLVLDDFGQLGRAWRETDERVADRDVLIRDLLDGQYRNPVRIAAFNTTEGWSRDVTEEIAVALHERCADAGAVPQSLQARGQGHRQHARPDGSERPVGAASAGK